jgi:hypothetical protein
VVGVHLMSSIKLAKISYSSVSIQAMLKTYTYALETISLHRTGTKRTRILPLPVATLRLKQACHENLALGLKKDSDACAYSLQQSKCSR